MKPLELKTQKRVALPVSPQEKHTVYLMKLVSKAFWPTFYMHACICKYTGVNSPLCRMFTKEQEVPVANVQWSYSVAKVTGSGQGDEREEYSLAIT